MVSVTKDSTPALRFDGFGGDWVDTVLCDVVDRLDSARVPVTQKDRVLGPYPYYGANGIQDFINGWTHEGQFVLIAEDGANDLDDYPIYLVQGRIWVNNHARVVRGFSDRILNEFLAVVLKTVDFERVLVGGSRAKLNASEMMAVEFPTPPTLEEQRAIGELFSNLDTLIEQHRAKHTNLQQTKTALLQRMFPRDGADEPELRLGGFSGVWEAKPLKNLGSPYGGLTGKTKEDFGHGHARYITYLDVFEHAIIRDTRQLATTEIDNRQNEVKTGDVLFTVSSEVPEEVGMSAVWLGQGQSTYLNSFCFGFRPIAELDSKFLAYVLRSPNFREKMTLLAQGISRFNISKNRAMELEMSFPSFEEQRAIGEVFSTLDELIAAEASYITQLTQAKTALLQRMFV